MPWNHRPKKTRDHVTLLCLFHPSPFFQTRLQPSRSLLFCLLFHLAAKSYYFVIPEEPRDRLWLWKRRVVFWPKKRTCSFRWFFKTKPVRTGFLPSWKQRRTKELACNRSRLLLPSCFFLERTSTRNYIIYPDYISVLSNILVFFTKKIVECQRTDSRRSFCWSKRHERKNNYYVN